MKHKRKENILNSDLSDGFKPILYNDNTKYYKEKFGRFVQENNTEQKIEHIKEMIEHHKKKIKF